MSISEFHIEKRMNNVRIISGMKAGIIFTKMLNLHNLAFSDNFFDDIAEISDIMILCT